MDYNKIRKSIHMLIDLKFDIKFIVDDEQYSKIEKLIDKAIKRIEEEE